MNSEPLDFETIFAARREAAAASMQPVTLDELRALGSRLFPAVDHPWQSLYDQFLADHQGSQAVRGAVDNGTEFVFFPLERKGIWFHLDEELRAMGPIPERGLEALSLIAEEKGLV